MYKRLFVPLLWYALACFVLAAAAPDLFYAAMVWNVFLSALPLCFVLCARRAARPAGKWALMALWLLFFPNAVYMITDLIHVSGIAFLVREPYKTMYLRELLPWCRLMAVGFGAVLSMLMGLESMRLVTEGIRRRRGVAAAAAAGAAICILGAFGVYIGRFLRLNSWDVLSPAYLFRRLAEAADGFALAFTACYALGLGICLMFYMLLVQALRQEDRMR
jgi:uncharacterized membrane protein